MIPLHGLMKRNIKLFFKDKGMFFTSLITPAILLVLYATFLSNVYRDSFLSAIPQGLHIADGLIDGLISGQLISSILAVSCVTVAFCSNMRMVQDKADGNIQDFQIAPVGPSVLAMGYYLSALVSALLICFAAVGLCLVYTAVTGWYMGAMDIICLALDVFLLTLFGTALSSIVNLFLRSQGQITAVETLISAGYGFICGAYMPISQFSEGLQKVISFLPGTYGTALIRNHAMGGVLAEMSRQGFPEKAAEGLKDAVDCNIYFFGSRVDTGTMYLILGSSVILLIAAYIALHVWKANRRKREFS
ncbi:MAG TPA: ABC transporter permease [Firmicutes bacterium]|nr:ABC transporter permease [Bacillota bacterium]